MKANELREQSQEQLQQTLLAELEKHFLLRMKKSTGQLNNTQEIRNARRNIARIKTVLNDKPGIDS